MLNKSGGFDTVIWTNNPIESVLAEAGIYKNAAEIDPNAPSKEIAYSSGGTVIENPYTSNNKYNSKWAYSEFCWTNFYPIGNGRMAAMVAGGIDREVVQINEDTCWDGSPYGTLLDENGNVLTTLEQVQKAERITAVNQTGGSTEDGWRYFRGADKYGNPAEIGSADATVGDEEFRAKYPQFSSKSISNMSMNIDNSHTDEAVQMRHSLHELVEYAFLGKPKYQRAYKSFAEIYIDFGHKYTEAENYKKSLDTKTGIVTVEYDCGGSHFRREVFASYPDQTIAVHIESDNELEFTAQLHTYHSDSRFCKYESVNEREIKLVSAVTDRNEDGCIGTVNAIRFEAHMILRGDAVFEVSGDSTAVFVKGGKSADIYVIGATNYVDCLNLDAKKPSADCERYRDNILSKTYSQIKARHIRDFDAQFSKTSLCLENADGGFWDIPIEERVRRPVCGKSGFLRSSGNSMQEADRNGVYTTYSDGDNRLAELEFNYGKYLLISGARDGRKADNQNDIDIVKSQPLNLTGKWNAALSASWSGKYTININTEMNYWAAQTLGLAASERTLIDTFAELARSGSITARNQYNITNGRGDMTYRAGDPWVIHHNFDLWRGTQPIDIATAGLWPTGGAWLLEHAWQYYLYNKDEEYLAEIYPYMVGAAKFFLEFLVLDPKSGYLVTAASCSPEQGGVQPAPAMDTQLVRNLYYIVVKATEVLGLKEENKSLLDRIAVQMPREYLGDEAGRIAPNLIDGGGLIREWTRDDVEFDLTECDTGGMYKVKSPFTGRCAELEEHGSTNRTNHRHCSHLWELYPGTHISAYASDENEKNIFNAFKDSVKARGASDGKGWALAWRMCLSARCLDGETASLRLEQLLRTRTSPNLMDQHPNFQIDGNYGAAAGIIEMLIQSHDGAVTLLPALPERWQKGEFKGFNTREGVRVDLKWNCGKPQSAVVYARETKRLTVRSPRMSGVRVCDAHGNSVAVKSTAAGFEFSIIAGERYNIEFS